MDPIRDFLDVRDGLEKQAIDDLRDRQKREMEMWDKWRSKGMRKNYLRSLMKSFKPLINSEANKWATRNRDIPPAAIRAEFNNQFVNALKTYDPNRGAALNTHIRHQLKKARRFVTTYQNPGRIPENRVYQIGQLQNAEQRLDEQFGRPATQLELSDELKWSPKQVGILQQEIRKARPTGSFESDPSTYMPSRKSEILRMLPYDLSSEERQVFEYLHGVGGKPRLGPGQIARKLKMSAPKVSRLKRSIAEKYSQYSDD